MNDVGDDRAAAVAAPLAPGARATAVLREREARGLLWSMWARLAFMTVGAAVSAASTNNPRGLLGTLALIALALVVMIHNLRLVRARKRLLFVGRSNAIVDLIVISIVPHVWYWSVGGSDLVPATFNVKNEMVTVVILTMVINTLALRPLYPAIIALGGVVLLGRFLIQAALDPRVAIVDDNVRHALGPDQHLALGIWPILTVALAGAFLTMLAYWARRMVTETVALEEQNLRIMEAQAQAVLEAKMASLAALVSGVAHELNSPLGVMLSATETSARAATQIASGTVAQESDPRIGRAAKALADNVDLVRSSAARMQELLSSLKAFSRLDESEVEQMDLGAGLDSALSLLSSRRGQIEVVRDYRPAPKVRARARAINQVFMVVLENAHDALDGRGTLTLRVLPEAGTVRVEIQDDGPGMSARQLAGLFDLGFAARKGRIGMGLGLPNARRVIEAHGGTIEAHSAPGDGTTVRIALPVN